MEKQLRSLEALDAPEKETMHKMRPHEGASATVLRLFYCKQCGYVVFREEPPYVCPICRAKQEMFAEIMAL